MNKIGRIMPFILVIGIFLSTAAGMLLISNINAATGILDHKSALLCNLLYYGMIALTAIVAAVLAGIGKRGSFGKIEGSDIVDGGAVVIGFGLLLVALCEAYEGISELHALTPSLLLIIADFAGAAALGITAFVTLFKKEFKPGLGFAYVIGGLYFAARGVYCFSGTMAVTAFPEYLTDNLSVICASVFFVLAAKLLSGNSGKLTKEAFCFWGAGTAAITLSSALSAVLTKLLITERSDWVVWTSARAELYFQEMHGIDAYRLAMPSIVNISVGLFAAAAVIALCTAKPQNKE